MADVKKAASSVPNATGSTAEGARDIPVSGFEVELSQSFDKVLREKDWAGLLTLVQLNYRNTGELPEHALDSSKLDAVIPKTVREAVSKVGGLQADDKAYALGHGLFAFKQYRTDRSGWGSNKMLPYLEVTFFESEGNLIAKGRAGDDRNNGGRFEPINWETDFYSVPNPWKK
jgi:hypothetical protein